MTGRCWLFSDDIAVDGDLMPLEFALQRKVRPENLQDHILSQMQATLAGRIKPGDNIAAGKWSARGNSQIGVLLALAGARVGLVVESIPSGGYRNSINARLRSLPRCPDVRSFVADENISEFHLVSGSLIKQNTDGWTRLK
jgi:hypothetical protein